MPLARIARCLPAEADGGGDLDGNFPLQLFVMGFPYRAERAAAKLFTKSKVPKDSPWSDLFNLQIGLDDTKALLAGAALKFARQDGGV